MKTVIVRFGWWMPVLAEYAVEVPDDATPDQIVEAAHKIAEDDAWSKQFDVPDGITAVFVDEIAAKDAPPNERIPIPEKWGEDLIVREHFVGAPRPSLPFRIVENAKQDDEKMVPGEYSDAWMAWREISSRYSAEEINAKRVAIVELRPDGERAYEPCFV